MNVDVLVAGGGIFGQTLAGWLRTRGMNVLVVDSGKLEAGSLPSACLMKPSWLESIRPEDQENAYAVLDQLYGVQQLQFKVGPLKVDTVRWCDPVKIRQHHPVLAGEVLKVAKGRAYIKVSGQMLVQEARHVIVAAGVWTNDLVPTAPKVEARMGAACFWRNAEIPHNFISPWAPYRQLVAFNMGRDVWVGDGTAVKPSSWNVEREAKIIQRCQKAVAPEQDQEFELIVGRRPYVDKKLLDGRPCYLGNHDGVWVCTGGAKNGTIAAGWAAHRLSEFI